MRKITLIAMSILAVVALTACGSKEPIEITDTAPVETEYATSATCETDTSEENLPSPRDVYGEDWLWKKCKNKQEAEDVAGITLEAPLFGQEEYVTYHANKGRESIRIWYLNTIEEGDSLTLEEILVLKQHHGVKPKGKIKIVEQEVERDTSNDKIIDVNGNNVVLTMDGDNVAFADWSVGIYDYTLEIKGVEFTVEDAAAYIAQVK